MPKYLDDLRVSRTALRHYALYRRHSLIKNACTKEQLIHFHKYESTGKLPEGVSINDYRKQNGFANGKWALKVTEESICNDIQSGDFCKAEFYKGPCSWYWKKALKNTASGELFAWRQFVSSTNT